MEGGGCSLVPRPHPPFNVTRRKGGEGLGTRLGRVCVCVYVSIYERDRVKGWCQVNNFYSLIQVILAWFIVTHLAL